MSKQLDKSNLGYLGIDFQYRLVKCFMEEPQFFGDISSIVTQNSFSDSLLKTFVGTLKDYYSEINVVPSYETMLIILRGKANTDVDVTEFEDLVKKLRFETTLEGYSLIKEKALRFFKQQNLVRVANRILDIAKTGDTDRYPECQKLLDDAALVGEEDDFGHSPFDMLDKALSPSYTVHIPTGIKLLDESLNGGLAKKKVGVIIGSSGFGKSTLTTAIASFASTYRCDLNNHEGFKVLQIYFEDDDVDIARKHFSRLTQVEAKDLTRNIQQIDEIREVLNNYQDKETMMKNLRLKAFKVGKKSASDIGLFLKKLINTGWKPDLVLVDYFECLAPEKGSNNGSDNKYINEGVTMREFENIAKELDIALWLPIQGNKESMKNTELVTMENGGGSIEKIQAASVIITIARSVEQQKNNIATLALIKNRGGSLGVWKNIEFNNGTSTISCDNVITYDNTQAYEEDEKRAVERKQTDIVRKLTQRQTNTYQPKIGEDNMPF